jgi:polyferredoxin
MYRMNSDGQIENAFVLKITNKTQHEQEYRISINAANGLKLDVNSTTALLDAGEIYEMPVTVVGNPERVRRGEVPIVFRITGITTPTLSATVANRFRAPTASERAKALRAEQEDE